MQKPAATKVNRKIFWSIVFLLALLLIPGVRHALADYLGPNRVITTTKVISVDYGYWARHESYVNECAPYQYPAHDCIICTWQESPGSPCGTATYSVKLGTKNKTVTTTTTLPEATIQGTLQNCSLQNGWCTTATTLHLEGTEPGAGESITLIEGTLNGVSFACPGDTCDIPLVAGDNNFTYWALSSFGDSSQMGSLSAQVDATPPTINGALSGTNGANGWHISNVTLAASASDPAPGSGMGTFETSLDGITWAPYSAPLTFNDGVYTVRLHATDLAANVTDLTQTINVDTVPPTVDATLSGTSGSGGWYTSTVTASASASDATSGIASLEYAADGGAWTTYPGAVSFSDGTHSLQFKTTDVAGLSTSSATYNFKIDTGGPHIAIPDWWYVWESASFRVSDGYSNIASVRMTISDPQNHWPKVGQAWTPGGASFTKPINWDRHFADGTLAPIGTYRVTIHTRDAAGNESKKTAQIIIPAADATAIPRADNALLLPAETTTNEPEPVATETAVVTAPSIAAPPAQSEPVEPVDETILPPSAPEPAVTTFGSVPETEPQPATAATTMTSNNVLWGAAAAAAIGAATAYALEQERKRKEAEAKHAREAAKKAAKLNAAEEARKAQNWLEGQVILAAQQETTRVARKAALGEKMLTFKEKLLELKVLPKKASYILPDISWKQQDYANLEHAKEIAETNKPSEEKSWWDKTVEWTDNNQILASIGIGIAVGLGAAVVILTGGVALPVIAAWGLALTGAITGGGTILLNNYDGRDWHENLVRNLLISTITASVTAGITIVGVKVVGAVTTMCTMNPTCANMIEPTMKAVDIIEEISLVIKASAQTALGNDAAANEALLELEFERMDGGVPGNSFAKELGGKTLELATKYGDDFFELVGKYGDDAVELLTKYGDDAFYLLGAYGDNAFSLLLTYGDDAVDIIGAYGDEGIKVLNAIADVSSAKILLETLDDDVLEYAIKQGPDAIAALSRWSKDELMEYGPELALRAAKDAEVLRDLKELIRLGPIDPEELTSEQRELIKAIAANSTQYADNGQILLGKWVDYGNGFTEIARDTGSAHYNPHPDMWNILGDLGDGNREEAAWLINQQVIQTGIDKKWPIEYSLEGVSPKDIVTEMNVVHMIQSGASDVEIMEDLGLEKIFIRWRELRELQKAGYEFIFDEISNSFILSLP